MRLRQQKFSNQIREKEPASAGFFFVSRENRCYDGKSAVYRIRCSVCDGWFRLHRKQALQSKFSARIFTKHLTFPSGFGILFRQGLIDHCKSGCSAAGSVLDWGSRGRRFKSCHSDQIKPSFREKGRLFCNLFWVFKISQTAFGVCLGFILQKTRAFPRWERPFVMPVFSFV